MKRFLSSSITIFVITVLTIFITIIFTQNLLSLKNKNQKQESLEKRLNEIQEENKVAQENLEYLQSEKSLEIEARHHLNLKKAGETVVNIQPSTLNRREPISDEEFLKKYDQENIEEQNETKEKKQEHKKSFLEKVKDILSIVIPEKTQNVE